MQTKNRLSALAVGAVAMSLLLGANAAQAAEVIFEPGTSRAIRIENLQVGSTLYDVTFDVQATAGSVYGDFPGTYTFTDETPAAEARDAVLAALNVADALSIGESGTAYDGETFNVAYEGFMVLGVESVKTARSAIEGADWVPLGFNQWTYNLDERNYAVFSGGGGGDAPNASFTFSPAEPNVGQQVHFTDTSTGQPNSWEWDFDDGDVSNAQNPTHSFSEEGSYDVRLTVENSAGDSDTQQDVSVSSGVEEPEASFTFSPVEPVTGQAVRFTDTSTGQPDSWEWNFDDGQTSAARSPTHTFTEEGGYEVRLTVGNPAGDSDAVEEVTVILAEGEPEASFTFSPAEPDVGQSVKFTDTSGGGEVDSWEWDFDDGDTSTQQNPSHQFSEEGSYEVRLTVENSAGSTDTVEEVTVSYNEQEPQASFSFSPADPVVGQAVIFTDTSGGGQADTWEWVFDDGDVSSAQNPTHSFSEEGSYEVKLTVENSAGQSDAVEEVTVSSNEEGPEANFSFSPSHPEVGQSVRFTDTSGGGQAESWQWNFDDGDTSTQQNPSHQFSEEGSYEVRLNVENSAGGTDTTKQVTVSSTEEAPEANFSYSPGTPSAGQQVAFTNTSGGGAAEYWEWDFDDGETSSERSPKHIFDEPGSYNVTLRVVNSVGSDSTSKTVTVEDGPSLQEATFIAAASLASGAEGSFYQTDVDIANSDNVTATYVFLWLPRAGENSQSNASDRFTLAPGSSARYENILVGVFGLSPDVNGAIVVVSDSESLVVMSRTYNLPTGGASGTFGQAIEGVPFSDLIGPGEIGRIIFLSQNPEFRTNLGCVNGTNADLKISIDLFDDQGMLLETKTMNLAPFSNKQINKIFGAYAPTNGYADVRSSTADAAYYLLRIDVGQ